MEKSINKIEPGPFLNTLISTYLRIKAKDYSTNTAHAFSLMSEFMDQIPSSFNIDFKKHSNFQSCKISLDRMGTNYSSESGYFPMAVCLLFINSWCKPLKFYSYEFLKIHYEKHLEIEKRIEEFGFNDDMVDEYYDQEPLHPDIPALFKNLSKEQIKALVEYANR